MRDAGDVTETLEVALGLLEDPQIDYAQATPHQRRLLNQAIFDALLVRDEDVADANPQPWVTEIHRLANATSSGLDGGEDDHDPLSGAVGFNKARLVPRLGRQRNRQAQVEALVKVLLEPLGRKRRREVLELVQGR